MNNVNNWIEHLNHPLVFAGFGLFLFALIIKPLFLNNKRISGAGMERLLHRAMILLFILAAMAIAGGIALSWKDNGLSKKEYGQMMKEELALTNQKKQAPGLTVKEHRLLELKADAAEKKLANLQQSYEKELTRRKNAEKAFDEMKGQLSDSRIAEAKRSLRQKNTKTAKESFAVVRRQADNKTAALAAFHEGKLEEGDLNYVQGMDLYRTAVLLEEDNPDYLLAAGKMALTVADYDQAQEWLERLLKSRKIKKKDTTLVLNKLEKLYRLQGKFVEAQQVMNRSLAIKLSLSNGSVAEGDSGTSTLKLTVICSSAPRKNRDVTVKWSTSDATGISQAQATAGEDYTSSSGILTFNKGKSLQQQITIPIKGDIDVEEDEIFIVLLEQPVNATIANGVGEALIINDDINAPPFPAPDSVLGQYMLMSKDKLESLPTSGTQWNYLKAKADEAVAVVLNASKESSPWLVNNNDRGDGRRLPTKYLAAALVYASSYPDNKEPYRQAVENAIRHIIGSEEELGTDGTETDEAVLAVARQLTAWIMAADLIGFDSSLTGTRTKPGRTSGSYWPDVSFKDWLSTITKKKIGDHIRWRSLAKTQENSVTHWAAHCTASRVAVSLYLHDTDQLNKTIKIMKGFLGDDASYPTYPPTKLWLYPDGGFAPSSDFDPSWACNYSETKNGWRPINSNECGPEMDGIMVNDISCSVKAYPNWDKIGIRYSYETLAGLYLAAILLERADYPAFSWSDQALKRVILWIDRQNQIPSTNNYRCERHIPWIANYFYGLSFPTQPADLGRGLAFTDWLFSP